MPKYLDYHGLQTLTNDIDATYVRKTQKGEANGVATLDSGGKIPTSQIPESVGVEIDDTAGAGVTNKTWSANKLTDEFDSKAPKASPVFTGSISMGRQSVFPVGTNSVAIGSDAVASGANSFAHGSTGTYPSGNSEIISLCAASGNSAYAEGIGSSSRNDATHAEGFCTTASGKYSHSEGERTTASGQNGHAEGYLTEASGEDSHVEGYGTVARSNCQHVFGKYNIISDNNTYVEMVGTGLNNGARRNARTLDWDGNERLKGDLYIGCNTDSTGGSKVLASSEKGTANGLATLDANGKVPTEQLPSYVDDVVEYASVSAFPATGETGKIYVALDTNLTYRWSGSTYTEISAPASIIDDTAGSGVSDKTWSANKLMSMKGAANGYASLNGFGKIPIAQLPNNVYKFAFSLPANSTSSDLTLAFGPTTWSATAAYPAFSSEARVVGWNSTVNSMYLKDLTVTIDTRSISGGVTIRPDAASGTLELYVADMTAIQ